MIRLFSRFARCILVSLLAVLGPFLCLDAGAAKTLTVTNAMPKGQVRDLTQITVRFSENMRPLGIMDEQAKTAPLKLSVSDGKLPKGSYRWLDPATLAYLFDAPVNRPIAIRALVPNGTASLAGSALTIDETWDITTPPLALSLENQADSFLPKTKATIALNANYPLNAKQLREKSRLSADGKPLEFSLGKPQEYQHSQGRPSAWRYTYTIKGSLPQNSTVRLDIDAGLTARGGGDPLGKMAFSLKGFGDLRLTGWMIDGHGVMQSAGKTVKDATKPPRPENRLALYFNNPVRYGDLLGHITVTPAPAMPKEKEWDNKYANTGATLPYLWEPRTQYTLTVKHGLKDSYGTTLAKAETITFTTGDYHPFLEMPRGTVVLETALSRIFPLMLRNAATVTANVRYLPWGKDALRVIRSHPLLDGKEFQGMDGGRETAVVLDTTETPNKTLRENLDLPTALGLNPSEGARGLVTVRLVPPEKGGVDEDLARLYGSRNLEVEAQITDLGIAARLGDKQGLVWVTSIATGKPLAGASVRLLDKDGNSLWSGTTGDDGLATTPGIASFDVMPRFCMAVTEPGHAPGSVPGAVPGSAKDEAVLDLGVGGIPDDKAVHDKRKEDSIPWQIHAVTQLSLYQPGQTVNATVYARQHTGSEARDFAAWLPLGKEPLLVSVTDRNGKVAHSFDATTNAYGSVSFSFTLPATAEPGWYQVRAKSKRFHYETAITPFRVASFRPPEFKVDITPPPAQPVPADPASRLPVTVTAGYFSGALLPGGAVDLLVEATESYFTPPRLSGYKTGPDIWGGRYHGRNGREEARLAGKLDDNGAVTMDLPSFRNRSRPLSLFLTGTVTDASGLTSQGTGATLLHPSADYIGLRAPYIALKNKDVSILLKAATWDNKPLTGKTVSLKAERVAWEDGNEKKTTAWEKTHTLTDETGDSLTARFDRSGQYLLTAAIVDEENRKNMAATYIYVPGRNMGWAASSCGRRYDSGYLDFLTEDAAYAPGDTARLVIKNPFDKAVALVAIERDGVRRATVHEVTGENPVIDIPLEKADAPYVYASVLLVKGRTAPPPNAATGMQQAEAVFDEGAPSLHQGSVLLKVSGTEPALAVSVATDKADYRPGGTVRGTATVTDAGKPRKAQVTFLAVDERVLRAGGEFTTYDPTRSFGDICPNQVYGADLWRFLLKHHLLLVGPDREREAARKLAAPMPAQAMADMMTASGGSEDPDIAVRRDFTPLAFWLAEGATGNDGVLSVSFTLPDTLTSYRVVAVASDTEDGFANASISVRASQPLQLLPALPKFVTEGDTLVAGFLAQNTSPEKGEVSVALAVSGAVFAAPQGFTPAGQTQTITLDAGKSGLVTFPLRADMLAGPTGELRLRVTGRMGKETDGAEFILPVRPLRPVTTVAAAGLLGEGETYSLPVKAPGNPDPRSRLEVTFAPSPAAGIPLAAKQVIQYPWNCLEQRLSRAWARMIRLEHGQLVGLPPDATDREAVMKEFEAISSHQRQDGSFGLWSASGGPDEGGVFLYITAYALLVNHEGKDAGFGLPEDVTGKALAYIEKTLRTPAKAGGEKDSFRPAPETYAFALYVLGRYQPEKAAPLFGKILSLCEKAETNPLGWGSLLLAMDTSAPKKANTEKRILAALEKTAAVTPTHLHFGSAYENGYWRTLGSTLRDNAMVLAALATAKADYPRLEALAAWVGQRVGDTRVLSTQEAAFGLWGLAEYLRSLGGDRKTAIRAIWNGKDEASASFSGLMDPPTSWSLPAEALNGGNASSLTLTAAKGRPYWTARLAYASPDLAMKVENAGFTVARKLSAKGPWKVGDTVDVTVTVTVPATRRHVALFDPFPAGFEPLYTSRVDLADREKWTREGARFGPWQWQDTMDDGMLLYAPVIHPGTYTYTYSLRAAAAGTFAQRPTSVEEMYTPEVFGRTDAGEVTIQTE